VSEQFLNGTSPQKSYLVPFKVYMINENENNNKVKPINECKIKPIELE